MINSLYPWIYFSEGEGDGGGDSGGDGGGDSGGEGGDAPAGGYESTTSQGVPVTTTTTATTETIAAETGIYGVDPSIESKKAPIKVKIVDVTAIPGDKLLQSLVIPSSLKNPLIGGTKEGNVPAAGLNAPAYVVGNPGGKFYLNIVDINDDEVFDLSNVTIPASGKYQMTIPFPKSTATNKYKINKKG